MPHRPNPTPGSPLAAPTSPLSPGDPIVRRAHQTRTSRYGAAIGLGLLLTTSPLLAAPNPGAEPRGTARDLEPPQATPTDRSRRSREAEGVHRLTAQLNALGAVSCLARADQIARFLDQSNLATQAVMPLPSYPNQRLVVANMSIPRRDGHESLAILAMAPNQANGCGAAYQLMTTEPGSCVAALKARQAEPQGAMNLSPNILIQRLSQDSIFLSWQLKDTCLIVKQQNLTN